MRRTVLITGASRGIGRAVALRFGQEEKYNIVINSLTGGGNAEKLREELESMGCRCLNMTGDVGDESFVREMIKRVADEFGTIDVLVNNAGVSYVGLVQDMESNDWERIISTNLSAVHYCSKAVIPFMLRRQKGHIINISSVWGDVGASCEVAYSATKGGVNAYTKALAKELAPSGISVNAVACGAMDTDMNKCFSEDEISCLCEEIPAGRLGKPEEAAELIYAISNQSSYLTGQIITLSGGW